MNISGIAKSVSGVVKKTTKKAALDGISKGTKATKKVGKAALDTAAGVTEKFADTFLEYDENAENAFGGIKANKLGKIAVAGFTLGATILNGIETYDNNKKGTPQGVVDPTPKIEPMADNSYRYGRANFAAENYGAGGDLVFALNNLRRG